MGSSSSPFQDGKRLAWLAGMGLAAIAAGCATRAETPPPPPVFAAAPAGAEAATPEDAWVATLGSDELRGYVREALTSNPSLHAAEERARSVRERARAAAGSWLPSISLGLETGRTETPQVDTRDRTRADLTTSNLSAAWEADLWGRVLDRTRARFADSRAANADLAGARLSIAGQTARSWIDLVQSRQLLALADEDLAQRERALEITSRRYSSGLSNALALRTARSQVASARAAQASQRDALLQASRRLESLLARYPAGALSSTAEFSALPPIGAVGAPADLLARRPDVAAAEARLDAAGLRASEARKALLPTLTLRASASGAGDGIRDVADVDGLVTQVLAGLTMPIFNGGALRAEARASAADARAAAATYVETAIGAWREVEETLSADTAFAVREAQLAIAADEAAEAQRLAEREYANGVATIFELIDAYTRRIDAQRGLIQARASRAANRVSFHVALGGGAQSGGLDAPQQEMKP